MQNFTELYEVERRYEELAHRMSTPDAAANADEYARMMRDYKELTPLIEEYRRYTDLQQQETPEELTAKTAAYAKNWTPTAEKLWTCSGHCAGCASAEAEGK